MVEEHYSWTKVTTSVSNFLFGNPIIDHYGDMVSICVIEKLIYEADDTLHRLSPITATGTNVRSLSSPEDGADLAHVKLRVKSSMLKVKNTGKLPASGARNSLLGGQESDMASWHLTRRSPRLRSTSDCGRIRRNRLACPSTCEFMRLIINFDN